MATAASMGSDSEFLTLKQDFETWRKTRVHREAIPESLWMRAVELARRLGVTPVSRELRLGFRALKDRLEGDLGKKGQPGGPRGAAAFVELPPLGLATAPALGLVVEARHPDGTSVQIRVPKGEMVDLTGLLATFWGRPCSR